MTRIIIPLKNLRPKKIIQFCGITKKSNPIIYDDYRKKLIEINKYDFKNDKLYYEKIMSIYKSFGK